jgi:hypothetical protein
LAAVGLGARIQASRAAFEAALSFRYVSPAFFIVSTGPEGADLAGAATGRDAA